MKLLALALALAIPALTFALDSQKLEGTFGTHSCYFKVTDPKNAGLEHQGTCYKRNGSDQLLLCELWVQSESRPSPPEDYVDNPEAQEAWDAVRCETDSRLRTLVEELVEQHTKHEEITAAILKPFDNTIVKL